jgi:RNA polymerase sigma factor (sigma-70 family)
VGTREGNSQLERFATGEYRAVVATVARLTGDHLGAADAVQDAVLALLENPPRTPVDNLAAWITVVATNRARDRQRRRLAEGRALDRLSPIPEVFDAYKSIDRDVVAAIESLPFRQRQICILHYVLDESVESIAVRLAVSSGAVKTHLFRGRRALAARLARLDSIAA